MNKEELINTLFLGENSEAEFKECKKQLPKSLWETYSAFCNTKGGIIVLGIIENKKENIYEIQGVENIQNILKDFWNIINNKNKVNINVLESDDVKTYKIHSKEIIIININNVPRTLKPVYINNNPITGTYKRNFEGDYLCTEKEIRVLFAESDINTKDAIIIENMNIENINKETLESYRNRFKNLKGKNHLWNNLNDVEFLRIIGAIDKNSSNLTVAGLLIFGKEEDIVKILPNYFLDYREVLNSDINERWSHRITSWDENWSGNLFDFYFKIENRLTSDIEIPFVLDENMTRIENTEIHECIREALANTLIHSAYFQSGSIVIEKGINYFKFSNPGNMRVPFYRAKYGGESDPRNALIHKIFSIIGLVERAGSGIHKITNAWNNKKWIAPEITEFSNPDRTILKLTMKKQDVYYVSDNVVEYVIENVVDNLSFQENNVLKEIVKNPRITQIQIAKKCGITPRQISRIIKELKEKRLIERKGSDKKGYWKYCK